MDNPLRTIRFCNTPPDHYLADEPEIHKERLVKETFLLRELFFADVPEKHDNLGLEMGSNE